MKTNGTKLKEILFGRCTLRGGTPVVADLNYPQVGGFTKVIRWSGNEGLISHLIKRIEDLEMEMAKKENRKTLVLKPLKWKKS